MLPSALSGFMLPDWAVLILLLIGGVYALALLAMPFAVFGVKSRLSAIEEQLEDIQEELRVMALRQAGARIGVMDQVYPEPAKPTAPAPMAPMTEPPLRRRDSAEFTMARSPQAPTQPPPAPPPPPPSPSAEPSLRESFGRARPSSPPPAPPAPPAPPRGRRIEPRLD
ncbi:hypothetical protein [Acidiphilium sp. MT5]